jgi:thiosulfate reductase/polysulfide reductase chain A
MPDQSHRRLTRRSFLKAACAGTALAAAAGQTKVLSGLVAEAGAATAPWQSKFSACDMCFNRCGLIARVENGVVTKLDPNPKFLKSRGMLCAKGNAGIAQLYDPNRLKYPLKRVGARGEGKWQRIGWDEALDLAASKMKEIGGKHTRCGMWFTAGSDLQSQFVTRFAEVYGSFNVTSHESLCLLSNNRAFLDTFGEVPFADVLNSKYILMAGANRFEALVTPDSIDLMTAMREKGAKLVVLDPRYTKTAALADEWYPIRPGTDMAFMLALSHVIITENLYDAAWVAEKTSGLEELAAHVARYNPEWAEAECGVPAADIRRIARELAAAAPEAMVYPGRRSSDYENSTQIRRSFAIVNALLANWDRPGGLLGAREVGLKKPGYDAPWYDDNPPERADAGRAPMMFEEDGSYVLMREAVLSGEPYPVKGWFVFKTNPMQTAPDQGKTRRMIDTLDFMVVVDITMSDTAYLADLVLPAPSYLERCDPATALQGSSACACVVQRDPVVPALFESRPVFDILKGLASRLDLAEFFDFDIETYRAQQLAGLTGAKEALEQDGVYYNPSKVYGIYEGRIYKTLSQRIELFNKRYDQMGLDPLPVYSPPKKGPDKALRLVVGRSAIHTQSSTQDNALLNELEPTNALWLNPADAAGLNVADGETVEVASSAGKGRLPARVTPDVPPGLVYMATGFGSISPTLTHVHGNGCSIASLLADGFDAISGNAALHETFVTVTRSAS